MNLQTIVLRNILNRKSRTALTVLGVSVSIAAFVALTGITRNLERTLKMTYESRGTDLIVMEKGIVDILSSSISGSYLEKIKSVPGVEDVTPILFGFYTFNLMQYVLIYGWEKGSYLFEEIRITGRPPQNPNEAMVGGLAANRLHKKIGDEIAIKGVKLSVVGTFQSKSLLEDGAVVMLLERLQEIRQTPGKVTAFNIKVRSNGAPGNYKEAGRAIDEVQQRIEVLFPDLEVKNVQTFMSSNTPLFIILGFTWAVSVIAFIIVILGIVNTMTTSVLERTEEIGILRAIGWRNIKIIYMVLYESLIIGLLGGIVGIVLGYVIMNVLASRPQLEGFMSRSYDWGFILIVAGISGILGLVSGLYPAMKAISIEPIRVLRHE
jgi:putative ABC transport system permease protein